MRIMTSKSCHWIILIHVSRSIYAAYHATYSLRHAQAPGSAACRAGGRPVAKTARRYSTDAYSAHRRNRPNDKWSRVHDAPSRSAESGAHTMYTDSGTS